MASNPSSAAGRGPQSRSPAEAGSEGSELPAFGRDGKREDLVQAMFDRVAPRYDLANTILSGGRDRAWRRIATAAAVPDGAHVLDVAAGTGVSSAEYVRQGADRVVAFDLSHAMLAAGERAGRGDPDYGPIEWVQGDAQHLPFEDATFDVVAISFGLRNVPDPRGALAEFHRVARPGARLVVLEFAAPTNAVFRRVYLGYLMRALPEIAKVVTSDPRAYVYLAESIRAWPDRRVVADWIEAAGWRGTRVRNPTGGIVAIHRATR